MNAERIEELLADSSWVICRREVVELICRHALALHGQLDAERRISAELNRQLREWEDFGTKVQTNGN